jgi:hypothetical protein
LEVEITKTKFMEQSFATLQAGVDAVEVKLEAELGHWYNTVVDCLRYSNFSGTLFH